MKLPINHKLLVIMGVIFWVSSVIGCAGDPRKNCNHPKHAEWVKEKTNQKYNRK